MSRRTKKEEKHKEWVIQQIWGKDVIGFDEIFPPFYNPKANQKVLPWIITGHLVRRYHGESEKGTPHSAKEGVFSLRGKRSHHNIESRASNYLLDRNGFFYVAFERDFGENIEVMLARAYASISIKHIIESKLVPENTGILIHQFTDNKNSLEEVAFWIDQCLTIADVRSVPVYYVNGGEAELTPLHRADVTSFNLAALKYIRHSSHWPFRKKKISYDYFEEA